MGTAISRVTTHVVRVVGDDAYLGELPPGAPVAGYFVRPPWRSLYSRAFESLLVRIESSDGTVGWGEALAPVGPEVPAAVIDRLLGPVLIGQDPRDHRPLISRLAGLMRERGHLVGHQADALAACDIALHDLAARLFGCSVTELLGGAFRRTIPTYVSGLPRPDDAARAKLAGEWIERGVRRFKLALGYGVEQDLATYDAVAAMHPGLSIGIDAHWAYDLSAAIRLGRALDERGAWFLEAPLAPEDVAGHHDLAAALATPVALGEALRNRFEFGSWLEARSVDLLQPDVARTGFAEALAASTLASYHHVRVAPHHSVGLGVSLAAGLHLSAAIDNFEVFEMQPSTLPHANRILTEPLTGGPVSFELPTGIGLGVEVDEQVVSALGVNS